MTNSRSEFSLKRKPVLTFLMCALAVLGVGSPGIQATVYAGNGTLANSLSAKSAGRGGANLAFRDNGMLLHDNPGGVINSFSNCCLEGQTRFDFGFAGLFPSLRYTDPQNSDISASNNPFGLGYLSFSKKIDPDIAIGLGAFTPAGFGATWDQQGQAPVFSGQQFYKSLGMLTRILPGISVNATDRLSLGATLGVAISHVELEGPYYINSLPLTGTPTPLDLQATGAALSWSLGMQYQLSDATVFAARYQSQNRFQNNGNARVNIPTLGFNTYDTTLDIVWPRVVGLGLQHDLGGGVRLGIDADWVQWSRASDTIDLLFSDPDNPVYAMFAPVVPERLPLQWRDSLWVRSGIEKDLGCGHVGRLGYAYGRNPVNANFATTYIATNLVHTFSAGYGVRRGRWEFDAAYQYAFGPAVEVGTSGIAGGDFSNSSISTKTHWMFFSATTLF